MRPDRRSASGPANWHPASVQSGTKKLGQGVSGGFGRGFLGLGLGHRVSPGRPVDRQHGPRTDAILATQLDVKTSPVVLDPQTVLLIALLVQNPSPIGIGDERGPTTDRHSNRQPQTTARLGTVTSPLRAEDRATGSARVVVASLVDDLGAPLGRPDLAEIPAEFPQMLLGVGDDGLPQSPRLIVGRIDELTAAGQRPLHGGVDIIDKQSTSSTNTSVIAVSVERVADGVPTGGSVDSPSVINPVPRLSSACPMRPSGSVIRNTSRAPITSESHWTAAAGSA